MFRQMNAAADVQAAPVARKFLVPGKLRIPVVAQALQRDMLFAVRDQEQISQGHIAALVVRNAAEGFVRQFLRLPDPAFPQQCADGIHRAAGVRVDAVPEAALPQAVQVQLKAVHQRSAEAHGAHKTVADGKRLIPVRGRPAIPEQMLLHVHLTVLLYVCIC